MSGTCWLEETRRTGLMAGLGNDITMKHGTFSVVHATFIKGWRPTKNALNHSDKTNGTY